LRAQSEIDALVAPPPSASNAMKFRSLHHAGVIARLRRDSAAAQAHQQAALQALGSEATHALRRQMARTELALVALDQSDAAQALRWLEAEAEADTAAGAAPTMPAQADHHLALGRAWLAQGRAADAERALTVADAFWRDFDPGSRWAGEAAYWLGRCHAALGHHAAARQALARAARVLATSPFADDRTLLARSTRE
jgi:tetratricopeptide (TPR) repeat protein